MFDTKTKITWLLLAAATACTPLSDDDLGSDPSEELELDEQDPRLTAEQQGAEIPSATFARPDDREEQQRIAELRAAACEPTAHPGPPDDFVAPEPAPGVAEPRFRVTEDQAEASRDAWLEADEADEDEARDVRLVPSEATIAAQARYLAETQELAPAARAARKAELLGE